ncbi:FliA/WhiG family RNA polymerase sigma factor [Bacillaceae bacterium S4-13-56]
MEKQSSQEQMLWRNWANKRDSEAANELIKYYIHLVHYHVQRISVALPQSANKDDLFSLGLIGLYDALEKFEMNRDLKFETYASFRIKGAILDGLRKEDWLPRSMRDKTKKIETEYRKLEQELNRTPTIKEIANQLSLPAKEVEDAMKDSFFSHILSIEEKPKEFDSKQREGIGYSLPDETSKQPDEELLYSETVEDLQQGIRQLNQSEQMVVSLFYHEELTLTEIGQVLGLTTSRISQIHSKALYKLGNYLKKAHAI